MPSTPDIQPEPRVELIARRGLPWPAWVLGLIAMLAGILYLFVINP